MSRVVAYQRKVIKYCKEQGIYIGDPIHDGNTGYVYLIDMKDLNKEQFDYINKLGVVKYETIKNDK